MKWSERLDGAAIRLLSQSTSVSEAVAKFNAEFGTSINHHSFKHRFKSQGFGVPSDYIKQSVSLTDEPKRVLFVPDAHHPFVDADAWVLLLKTAREWKPDVLVVLGDFADFYAVSFFSKNPTRKNLLSEELEVTREALTDLVEACGPGCTERVFLEGNHEERLTRYITANAPALAGLMDVDRAIGITEAGFEFVPYKRSYQLGKLRISHDFGKHGHGAILDARNTVECNAVIGHVHSLGTVYRANIHGDVHVGASFGWLGSFEAIDYRHADKARRDWSHGFGIGRLEENGNIHLQAIPVVGRKVCIEGKIIAL